MNATLERLNDARARALTLPLAVRIAAVGLLAFVGLAGWAVSSPVGSSPDDDFHLASIWCAPGQDCPAGEEGLLVPADAVLSPCYAFDDTESAACQGPAYDTAPVERVDWTRGNYDEHLYPGGFYATLGALAGDDITTSVTAMRLLNAAVFVALMCLTFAAVPARLRPLISWSLLLTAAPLALFIIPSTNPSSWAFTSAYVTFVAFAGYLESATGRRRWILAGLAAAGAALGIMSRADAAGFSVAALALAVAVIRPERSRWVPAAALAGPVTIAAAAVVLTSRQSLAAANGLAPNAGPGGIGGIARSMLRNVVQVLDLVQGALGGWGLGWLDTAVPRWVSVVALLVLGAVLAASLRGTTRWHLLVVGVAAVALIGYPLYVLAQTGAVVGGYFQPRYLFPLLVLLVMVAVYPVRRATVAPSFGQAWFLWTALSASAGLAQYALIRRFVSGTDASWVSLNSGVEWWGGPSSPMVVWIASTLALSAVIAALVATLAPVRADARAAAVD